MNLFIDSEIFSNILGLMSTIENDFDKIFIENLFTKIDQIIIKGRLYIIIGSILNEKFIYLFTIPELEITKILSIQNKDGIKGDAVEDEAVEDEAVKGDAVEDEAVEDEAVKGDAVEDEAVEDEAVKGDAVEDEVKKGNEYKTVGNEVIENEVIGKEVVNLHFNQNVGVRLIYPASDKHIKKYTDEKKFIIEEFSSYLEMIKDVVAPKWIDNILLETSKGEQIFLNAKDYFICADYKWNGNKDCLYLLCIFKNPELKSIRNIKSTDLLISAKRDILNICKNEFNLDEEQVYLFFHYPPTYLRLHIHIINISNGIGALGSGHRNIHIDEAIENIKLDLNYYELPMYLIN